MKKNRVRPQASAWNEYQEQKLLQLRSQLLENERKTAHDPLIRRIQEIRQLKEGRNA